MNDIIGIHIETLTSFILPEISFYQEYDSVTITVFVWFTYGVFHCGFPPVAFFFSLSHPPDCVV